VRYADVVRRRRMVRDYDPDRPVPPEVTDRLLGYALRAPSAGNTQGWRFLILDTPVDLDRFWTATTPGGHPGSRWLAGMRRAPLIVVVHASQEAYRSRYAEPDKASRGGDELPWTVPYWDVDAGFAALLILLGAVDESLGACFFGIPNAALSRYREAFSVPDSYHAVGAITVGYPAPDHRSASLARRRLTLPEVAFRGQWGSPADPALP